MKIVFFGLLAVAAMNAQTVPAPVPDNGATPAGASQSPLTPTVIAIKRVYVEALTGDGSAEAIRQLIIASLQRSHLFMVTDNPDRADATLRGAANDTAFTDTFDSQDGTNARSQNSVLTGRTNGTTTSRTGALSGGLSIGEDDAQHTRERKHEAYATVRLCNRDGDVLWATTQESRGAKFRGASADVAEKVLKQLQLDVSKASRERASTAAVDAGTAAEPLKSPR